MAAKGGGKEGGSQKAAKAQLEKITKTNKKKRNSVAEKNRGSEDGTKKK